MTRPNVGARRGCRQQIGWQQHGTCWLQVDRTMEGEGHKLPTVLGTSHGIIGCAVLCRCLCRLPNLSSVSINVKDSEDGDIDYVLALMHMHATGVRSLSLQIDTSWVCHDETWGSLGKMTNLTELHLTFNDKVREQGWA